MKTAPSQSVLVLFLLATAAAQAPPLDPQVASAVRGILGQAYAAKEQPDLQPWLRDLGSDDEARRRHAGAVLHALLVQVDEDQRQGRTPPREGMKLWGGPQEFGGELRWRIAEGLAEASWPGDGAAVEAAAVWLFRHSPRVDERANAMQALVRIGTPAADAIVREVVQGAHPTFRVLTLALQAAGRRGMKDLAPAVAALRGHYQTEVQKTAIEVAAALGCQDAAPAVDAARLPASLVRWLELAADLTAEPVAADAAWSKVTLPADEKRYREQDMTLEGWLLRDGDGKPRAVLLPWGSSFPLHGEQPRIAAADLADYGRSLLRLRQRYDQADMDEQQRIEGELGIRRFMHSSGQTWRGSAAEILVAAWLRRRGDEALAAQLMLPLLCAADDEKEFFGGLLTEVAAELDEAMLQAFAMARDYPRALAMAQQLARPECSFWYHQDRAIALAGQLPRRLDDFEQRRLPTPDEWQQLQQTLPRREQVAFLVDRLRLLNCMQDSIPGGIDYGADQFREPFSAWRQDGPPLTKVVNPFLGLLAMDLRAEELELLLPLLTSTDHVLAYDLQRFLPQRPQSLHRLQWVAGTLFEAAAREDLIDPRRLQGSAAEREAQVDELRGWCKRQAGKPTADRLVERLSRETDHAQWRRAFWSLHALDAVRAADAAVQLCKRQPDRTADVARLLVLLDRREHAGLARDWAQAKDASLRFYGDLLLLAAGVEVDAVLPRVLAALPAKEALEVNAAVQPLLACKREPARAFLVRCLQGNGPAGYRPTLAFAQQLLLAGMPEAFAALDGALQDPATNKLFGYREANAPAEPASLVSRIGDWCGDGISAFEEDADAVRKAAAELRTWLRAEWESVQAGKPSTMRVEGLHLPWGDWQEPGPGWVRRL